MIKFIVASLVVISLASCATNSATLQQQRFNDALKGCDTQYGISQEVIASLGDYEIPQGWDAWRTCKDNVWLSTASGTVDYPFVLEKIAREREAIEKFKEKKINRAQMNIEVIKINADVSQKVQQRTFEIQAQAAQAQAARAQGMRELGMKLMQGNTANRAQDNQGGYIYNSGGNCPFGFQPWHDEWGNPVCKKI